MLYQVCVRCINHYFPQPPPIADLQQKDREMLELLQERVTVFCELAEVTSGQEGLQPPITRYLFRADIPQAPRAEKLLLDATAEGNTLSIRSITKCYLFVCKEGG